MSITSSAATMRVLSVLRHWVTKHGQVRVFLTSQWHWPIDPDQFGYFEPNKSFHAVLSSVKKLWKDWQIKIYNIQESLNRKLAFHKTRMSLLKFFFHNSVRILTVTIIWRIWQSSSWKTFSAPGPCSLPSTRRPLSFSGIRKIGGSRQFIISTNFQ